MSKEQEQFLRALFNEGALVFWSPGHCADMPVKSISQVEDEPGLCAFLDGGKYVALYNENLSSFYVATKHDVVELFNNALADAT